MRNFLLRRVGGILVYDYALGIVATFCVGAGLWTLLHGTPTPIVTQTSPNTITVQVPGPITTKVVKDFVTDTTEVNRLLAENKQLKIQVKQISETLASVTSHGSGDVVRVDTATEILPDTLQLPVQPSNPPVYAFKDYRLHFVSDGIFAKYDLTQRFEVLTSSGITKDGIPTTTVKLFELGPQDVRMPVSDIKTTAIFAAARGPHWYVRPHVQAGLALVGSNTGTSRLSGGILGVQWLKRGTTNAPRDTRFAVLTPVVFMATNVRELGVLPFSYNMGSIRKQPFTNIWLSPYVGWSGTTVSRLGFSVTATF